MIRRNLVTVMISKRDNWRWVMKALTVGLDVEYWPQERTKSGNWIIAATSSQRSNLDKLLERAAELT